MKLSDLTPNPRNPRTMSDERKAMLRKSLDQFGDLGCIVFNIRPGHLVGGNQRGGVLPPDAEIIITQKYDVPTRTGTVAEGHVVIAGDKFKYREVDWAEEMELAAMVAANKHSGEWDYPKLNEVILQLEHSNYDMELAGYSESEMEKQLTYVPPTTTVGEHERELPKEKELDENIKTDHECPSCGHRW